MTDSQPPPVRFAVMTVSDTRTPENDASGDLLAARIAAAGHSVADRTLIRDDVAEIRATVEAWLGNPSIDAIITTGGTGFTSRDVTPEAIESLLEKRMDGFSALFHRISFETVGTSAIQSRAMAGVARGTLVFCLPGSPGACRDAWDGILKQQFDAAHRPCNFIEILPRLHGR